MLCPRQRLFKKGHAYKKEVNKKIKSLLHCQLPAAML
jgi:hypothetical protein